ncbi:sensor domain-containing diguanylate cyclase [Anaerobacillus isosaccharinicus]|uniref:Diguanylate cyclase n=1 Tax=Anaerobacillus isosaccharinicus TaxID=1532552 RepID=A0A1S2LLL5_9BACI|nr:diguanylate cyclase [Anaerobacillus isosaccharinicus]MBA5585114.1 diguanylate cyclase [Anaerobacillus isosaccharinicus]QOY36543.1 diguanylate cyclase [Anaerobacillus isosaccharinicus]
MFSTNTSLKNVFKLGVAFLVLLIAITNIVPLMIEKKHHEEEIAESLERVITLQHLFIEKWMDERVKDIRTLASAPVVKAADQESMRSFFNTFVDNNHDFAALVYVNKEGLAKLDTNTTEIPNTDLSDRQYFLDGREGKDHISDVLIGRNTGAAVIVFSSPIYDENGFFQGLVLGPVKLDTIVDLMNQLEIGETGETYITDKNGVLITNIRKDNAHLTETEEKKTIVPDLLQKAQRDESIEYYQNYKGVTVLGTYKWTNNGDWLIIGEIEKSEVFKSFYHTMIFLIVVSLIILIITYIFMSVIYQRIQRSIDYVLSGAKLINGGKYTTQIDKEVIKQSPEEFRKLCDVFNEMAATVRNTIDDLETSEEKLREDIVKRKEAEEKLYQANKILNELSRKDGLTSIANRRQFDETFEKEWQSHLRNGKPLSIILFDIDFFKPYNDTYGHQNGDECLKSLSSTVQKILKRPRDLLARYGGEEFVIILPETNVEGATHVAEKVRKGIESLQIAHSTSSISDYITVSVGISTIVPSSHVQSKLLIEKADKALYVAKSSGRNIVRSFE